MLLVYTDPEGAAETPNTKVVVGLAARIVLEMAWDAGVGVLVATGVGASASWAAVVKEEVAAVLALPPDATDTPRDRA